ncbi:hypothetical protein Ancab_025178 [Ancistrocladus abbreviatus]
MEAWPRIAREKDGYSMALYNLELVTRGSHGGLCSEVQGSGGVVYLVWEIISVRAARKLVVQMRYSEMPKLPLLDRWGVAVGLDLNCGGIFQLI